MKKRASGKRKIRTEIWVALIGLFGVIVTAIFGSPVLVKWLERTPTPAALTETTNASPIPDGGSPASPATTSPAPSAASLPAPSSDCQPAGITELPAQAVAVIESIDGTTARISLDSLRFENQTRLRLASGIYVDFSRMKRVDLANFSYSVFTVDVAITLLDCTVHRDIINSGSDSNLTGDSSLGAFQLYILQVKSIVFEW